MMIEKKEKHKQGRSNELRFGARQKAGTAQAAASAADFDEWYRKHKANAHYGVDVKYRGANSHADSLASRASAGWKLDGSGAMVGDKYKKVVLPWEDPLAPMMDKASNTVACTDLPEWDEDFDADSPMKVYYHSRWPSKPANVIIDEAVAILRDKKGIGIKVLSKGANVRYGESSDDSAYMDYRTLRRYAPNMYKEATIGVEIPVRAFDRMSCDIDKSARLRGRMNTDTYITLRIAFLLLEAAKLNDGDAKQVKLDVIKIHSHSTKPKFQFE